MANGVQKAFACTWPLAVTNSYTNSMLGKMTPRWYEQETKQLSLEKTYAHVSHM